jgi:guanylate kinase
MTKGNLIIVSAPSGAGKSSLVASALINIDRVCYSISYTTRQPRGAEQHGVDYYFVSQDEFFSMRRRGEFLEWAEVHGHFYGTQRAATEKLLEAGMDVLLDIDVQGAAQLLKEAPQAVAIFILPPSRQALEERLRKRDLNSKDDLERRLRNARQEVQRCREFPYLIINDDFKGAYARLEAIIRGERQRTERQQEAMQMIISDFGGVDLHG